MDWMEKFLALGDHIFWQRDAEALSSKLRTLALLVDSLSYDLTITQHKINDGKNRKGQGRMGIGLETCLMKPSHCLLNFYGEDFHLLSYLFINTQIMPAGWEQAYHPESNFIQDRCGSMEIETTLHEVGGFTMIRFLGHLTAPHLASLLLSLCSYEVNAQEPTACASFLCFVSCRS